MLIHGTDQASLQEEPSTDARETLPKVLRVLHVVSNMDRCGMQSMIMNYYRHIDRNLFQFDFLCHYEKGDYEEEIIALGGRIFRIANPDLLHPWRYSRDLKKFYRSHPEFTIVHSHLDKRSGIILREAQVCGVPIRIAHSHSTKNPPGILKNLYKTYASIFLERVSNRKVACCRESGIWLFGSACVEHDQVRLIPNAIDTERFAFNTETRKLMRNRLGIPDETLVMVHVGSFTYPKNHQFIIEMAESLIKKGEKILFILIGEGPLRNDIVSSISEKKLSSLFLCTGIREDIADILQASDLFVMPSHYEGFPLTMVEAQASGLPCLVSDRITRKADLTGLVEYLSIDQGVELWVDRIGTSLQRTRRSESERIREAGFSITHAAGMLEELYRGN